MRIKTIAAATVVFLAGATMALADSYATRDEAVAMVKKAVATIKSDGTEKSYQQINEAGGKFVDRDLYIAVLALDGTTAAHGASPKLIGKNLVALSDVDGKFFVKEMVERGAKENAFWVDYKFANPTTKKIQPKEMYCERLNDTLVCSGVYKP